RNVPFIAAGGGAFGDEVDANLADGGGDQQVPVGGHGVAGDVDQPADDELAGAAEEGDGDGVDGGEGAAADRLRQAFGQGRVERTEGEAGDQVQQAHADQQ